MLATLLFLSSYASADPGNLAPINDDRKEYRSVTQIDENDFLQLKLRGQLLRPAGTLTLARPQPTFVPLFQLRHDFDQEIDESTRMFGT